MSEQRVINTSTENKDGLPSSVGHRLSYRVLIVLCYLVIITALVATFTLSKYTSEAGGDSSAEIATFSATYSATNSGSSEQTVDLTDMVPGEEREIKLVISNDSQVSISYEISAVTYGNLPLSLTFKNSDRQELASSPTGEIRLGGDEDVCYLSIKWDSDKNSSYYASEIDAVTITMAYEQLD